MLGQIARAWQTRPEKDWRAIAQRKQHERRARLPAKWSIGPEDLPKESDLDVTRVYVKWMKEEDREITSLSVVALAAAMKDRKYAAVKVIEAFAHRATIAQQMVNA